MARRGRSRHWLWPPEAELAELAADRETRVDRNDENSGHAAQRATLSAHFWSPSPPSPLHPLQISPCPVFSPPRSVPPSTSYRPHSRSISNVRILLAKRPLSTALLITLWTRHCSNYRGIMTSTAPASLSRPRHMQRHAICPGANARPDYSTHSQTTLVSSH